MRVLHFVLFLLSSSFYLLFSPRLISAVADWIFYLLKFEASVRLCAPWSQKALTLYPYPATDCAAVTDISGVSGRWQLSR